MTTYSPLTHSRVEVDELFDGLREKVFYNHPDDIVGYLQHELSAIAEHPRESCKNIEKQYPDELDTRPLTVVVLGASGDLARKKTFPALFQLYCNGLLPRKTIIVGYARSEQKDLEAWKKKLSETFNTADDRACHVSEFLKRISYCVGSYDNVEDFQRLNEELKKAEEAQKAQGSGANRLFYLALPPTAFVSACTGIRKGTMSSDGDENGWMRVIVEKPFGRDTDSSNELSAKIAELFHERHIYRIDHYLGKEMVQNILTTRFANRVFSSVWNSSNIASVQITFKEKIGTEGRGGYFDNFGIIRDVMQNHLTQILALVAMEKPHTLNGEDVRNEKVALLRCVEPARPENCVMGQYTASKNGSMPGYLEDPTVPEGSNCPTFAVVRLNIKNDRWNGVPFILKAGKAVEDKYVGIRIQFKDEIVPFGNAAQRNELVIRAQPSEAMYLKLTAKNPGTDSGTHQTELDLTYAKRYHVKLPEAYESLIYESIVGNATNFVRSDELEAAWKIFTPLLKTIDEGKIKPIPYVAGTRGPEEADRLLLTAGYQRMPHYRWQEKQVIGKSKL